MFALIDTNTKQVLGLYESTETAYKAAARRANDPVNSNPQILVARATSEHQTGQTLSRRQVGDLQEVAPFEECF